MSQLTSHAVRSRANYTGLTCLLLVAVGYVGVQTQSTSVSTGQSASALSANQDTNLGINQAILAVSSASQAATNTPDPADTNTPNFTNTPTKTTATEQTNSDESTGLQVTVNGQSINVPANSSVNQTIPNESGDGQTNVSISNSQSSTGTSTGYSFTSTHSNDSSSSNSVHFSTEHTSP